MSGNIETRRIHGKVDSKIGGENVDMFGYLRTSEPFGVFINKNISSDNNDLFEEIIAGAGSTSYNYNTSDVTYTTTGADGDRISRQTHRYFQYIPGKSQRIELTGVPGLSNDINLVIRSSTSGTPVETKINRDDWNVDKFDGTGPSGINLDTEKSLIFFINYQWLGVGSVQYSLVFGKNIFACHQIDNANEDDKVYMRTGTLPIRYEQINTGGTTFKRYGIFDNNDGLYFEFSTPTLSSNTMTEICTSVTSEGGFTLPGLEFSASQGTTLRSLVATTRTPVLALRLVNDLNGNGENRKTIQLLHNNYYASGADIFFELVHMHEPSAITASWTAIGGSSGAEYSTDITAITGIHQHIIDTTYLQSGNNRAEVLANSIDFINNHSFLSQNIDSDNSQVFIIYATTLSGTGSVGTSFNWVEFE